MLLSISTKDADSNMEWIEQGLYLLFFFHLLSPFNIDHIKPF